MEDVPAEIRSEHLLKMSEDRYRYANLLAHKGVMFGN
jgi:hypothetical protein